jgi:hypothetical protein
MNRELGPQGLAQVGRRLGNRGTRSWRISYRVQQNEVVDRAAVANLRDGTPACVSLRPYASPSSRSTSCCPLMRSAGGGPRNSSSEARRGEAVDSERRVCSGMYQTERDRGLEVGSPDTIVLIHGLKSAPTWLPLVATHLSAAYACSICSYANDDRAPLLFIAGGKDHIMPPAVNRSNAKHYSKSSALTDYQQFPDRAHYTIGQPGWEEVADYALSWATEHALAGRPPGDRLLAGIAPRSET